MLPRPRVGETKTLGMFLADATLAKVPLAVLSPGPRLRMPPATVSVADVQVRKVAVSGLWSAACCGQSPADAVGWQAGLSADRRLQGDLERPAINLVACIVAVKPNAWSIPYHAIGQHHGVCHTAGSGVEAAPNALRQRE